MPESTEPEAPDPKKPAEPVSEVVRRSLMELADWQFVTERMKARNSSRKLPRPEPPTEDAPGAPTP